MEKEPIRVKRKAGTSVPELVMKNGIPIFCFPLLEETGLVTEGFTTKLGGVSTGVYASMNLSFTRGDDPAYVRENHRLLADALGYDRNRAVSSHQTHTDNIFVVTREDEGKGIVREKGYTGIDGLMTNVPGIALITYYADCIPVYLLDSVRRVIALVHAGWRGTVKGIGFSAVKKMEALYGTRPEDVLACIGPGICGDCYEVGMEVAEQFSGIFSEEERASFIVPKSREKVNLDLSKANETLLLRAGVRKDHIEVSGVCTRCNPDLFFSQRVTGDARGNMAAVLCLKEEA